VRVPFHYTAASVTRPIPDLASRGVKAAGKAHPSLASLGGELVEGVFENSFIKQNGRWKIQSVHFYPRMIVDAATGWAKSAKPAPGPSKQFPPDRPPTISYEIYPKFEVTPFHFDNPVTGKAPQYPERVLTAEKPTPTAAPPPRGPAIRNAAALEARLAELEHAINVAKAYDAAENLIGAYACYLAESPSDMAGLFVGAVREEEAPRSLAPEGTIFVNQILQPVIDIAADGKSAKVRARLLDLGGIPGGRGF
jgi:hypothetical protein